MRKFGLLGRNIEYSFSRKFFKHFFEKENIRAEYVNFDLDSLPDLKTFILENPSLEGFNVTIPYKESILSSLHKLDDTAQRVQAVNTVKIVNGESIGYNTDVFGFTKAIFPMLENHHEQALILGTGGAAKAIAAALKSMSIATTFVSRTPQGAGQIHYEDLSKDIIQSHYLIVNCTPVGTSPKERECPAIPYKYITEKHFLFDLVYNPPLTKFLAFGKQKGAKVSNGLAMLEYQALRAWDIWNKNEENL